MRFTWVWILIISVFVLSALQISEAGDPETDVESIHKNDVNRRMMKKKSTDWSKVDMNALEKEWEEGDEEEGMAYL